MISTTLPPVRALVAAQIRLDRDAARAVRQGKALAAVVAWHQARRCERARRQQEGR